MCVCVWGVCGCVCVEREWEGKEKEKGGEGLERLSK